jgi:predicted HicB family RNase H-like nuclease
MENMAKYKTIKLSPELHKKIKNYCEIEGYKLNIWIEKQLSVLIEKINKENE